MKKRKIAPIVLMAMLYSFLISPSTVFAANFDPRQAGGCQGSIFEYLKNISERAGKGEIKESSEIFEGIACGLGIIKDTLLLWVTLLAIFYIAMSGINYITAAGNEAKTKDAIKKLQSAIIGYLAFLCVFMFVGFFETFIQYDEQVKNFEKIKIDITPPS